MIFALAPQTPAPKRPAPKPPVSRPSAPKSPAPKPTAPKPSSPKTAVATSPPQLPPLNAAVVAYCEARIGQKVARGECAELAHEALVASRAVSFTGESPKPGDYVWGKLVATIKPGGLGEAVKVLPGDIVQYRDVVFERRTPNSWSRSSASHHTSVIAAARPGAWTLYEQNVNGRRTVGRSEVTLTDLKSGTLWVYRPLPK